MKTFIIDTNALLSFVTDRNPEQQATMTELFEQASGLDCTILCHTHVITEFVYVLEKVYGREKRSIRQMILDLTALPGIDVVKEINFESLLEYWPSKISDFCDSSVASLWSEKSHASVITFDKRFIKELQQIGARVCGH
jgi:predicted nucleic-acid-binding protein